jgi:hypothetical protein
MVPKSYDLAAADEDQRSYAIEPVRLPVNSTALTNLGPGARATAKSVLIIGPDPRYIDFSAPYLPPGMSAEKIIAGVDGARDRLADAGYCVQVLLTKNEETVEQQVSDALKERSYDVTVVGVGLRTLSPMAAHFERLINALHEKAPRTKIAFNSKPDDSDAAALRWL